jgi:hypothetical protein
MNKSFPLTFALEDGTHVVVLQSEEHVYEFHITKLNSEKHNFIWNDATEEVNGYENRYDHYEKEAISQFRKMREW